MKVIVEAIRRRNILRNSASHTICLDKAFQLAKKKKLVAKICSFFWTFVNICDKGRIIIIAGTFTHRTAS